MIVFCPDVRDFKIFKAATNFDDIKRTSNNALDLDNDLVMERAVEDSSILKDKKKSEHFYISTFKEIILAELHVLLLPPLPLCQSPGHRLTKPDDRKLNKKQVR